MPPESPDRPTAPLTRREVAVLHGISRGHTNGEIGRKLYLSEDTVKTHCRHLFRKLGVRDRAHAVRVAIEFGIIRDLRVPRWLVEAAWVAARLGPPPTPELGSLQPMRHPDPEYRDRHIAACYAAQACYCRGGSREAG